MKAKTRWGGLRIILIVAVLSVSLCGCETTQNGRASTFDAIVTHLQKANQNNPYGNPANYMSGGPFAPNIPDSGWSHYHIPGGGGTIDVHKGAGNNYTIFPPARRR